MRLAIVAPLVTAIREPQRGGSQAFVSDLARGLSTRSRGAPLRRLRIGGAGRRGGRHRGRSPALRPRSTELPAAAAGEPPRPRAPSRRVYAAVREARYDVVHNHAFDAPAISPRHARSARRSCTRSIYRPDDAVADALRQAARSDDPADGRRRVRVPGRRLAPSRPGRRDPAALRADRPRSTGRRRAGDGAVFAGRLSPEKGAAEAIDIARAAGVRHRRLRRQLRRRHTPGSGSTPGGPSQASAIHPACRASSLWGRWLARPSFCARRGGRSRSGWSPLKRRRAGPPSSPSRAARSAR